MQKSQDQYIHIKEEGDTRIFETGGVRNGIITRRAWNLFEYKNHKQRLMGHQDKSEGKVYPIVNAVTKAWFQ